MQDYAIHWFRRDLRVAGNPALQQAITAYQGRVLGIFCFDRKFLARTDFSSIRFDFFLQTLLALEGEMRSLGSGLMVYDSGPDQAFAQLLAQLRASKKALPRTIAWNRDYEPFALERDARLSEWFRSQGLHTLTARDHILIEPHEIIKDSKPSAPYQVFTPYKRKWLKVFAEGMVQARIDEQRQGLVYLGQALTGRAKPIFNLRWDSLITDSENGRRVIEDYHGKNANLHSISSPKAGSLAAFERLKSYADDLHAYGEARDFPGMSRTSRLSIYFKNGSLTTAQVMAYLELNEREKAGTGREKFMSELIWREFYYYILSRFPEVETRAFNAKLVDLNWQNNSAHFQAWCEGKTGFPIVDAGMRQLNGTGWMHNRVRMIVASFLTKDLLIDWRWGERYFMEKLLDGDLAPNNGGWQWAASTGCDPQPYFRIFNPLLQSKKFDPKGDYIRKHVPELAKVDAKKIHAPTVKGYPDPIVDHAEQRILALALFKEARKN